jgi:EAL domain-containing protein (putative c-di-GMP-specific phosphodiesterase class I)
VAGVLRRIVDGLWTAALLVAVALRFTRFAARRPRGADEAPSAMLADVARGLAAGEFELHFQPIARLSSGELVAAEALVRWRRADGVTVQPNSFVPLIENDAVFWSLTLELVDQGLREVRRWAHAGQDLAVAINISSATLVDPRLPGELERLLVAHRVEGRHLHLEITEGAIMRDADLAAAILRAVQAVGVSVIAIDDFGTGYSSLGRLRDLPVDAVKLDRSFIAEVAKTGDATFVKPIIELAHGLGMSVTAEGVEDRATWRRLAGLGCDHAQGYLIARPAPASVFAAWLRDYDPGNLRALSAIANRRQDPGRRGDDLVAAALASDDAVLVVDDAGRYRGANRAAFELWGPALEAGRRGTSVSDYLAPSQRSEFEARLKLVKADGRYEGDWEVVVASGCLRRCNVHAVANVVPGRHVFVLHAANGSAPAASVPKPLGVERRFSRERVDDLDKR